MADYIRNLTTDYTHPVVDNNFKLEDGAGPPAVQLSPWGDEFGNATCPLWTDIIFAGDFTIVETGGVVQIYKDGNAYSQAGRLLTGLLFLDTDISVEWEKTDAHPSAIVAQVCHTFRRQGDWGNQVYFYYISRHPTALEMKVGKYINGVHTPLASVNIGAQAKLRLRLQRVAATQTFTFKYSTWSGVAWNAWIGIWSGVINHAVHFNSTHSLELVLQGVAYATVEDYDIEIGRVSQLIAYRYWPDSPESTIREFDAGAGKIWVLTGCSDVKDEDGRTIRYKGQHSDDDIIYTTVDGAWQTIAQLNVNAAAGNYDGHRYVRFLAQFNSAGAAKPNITSFTMSGAPAVSAIAGPFGNLNYLLGGVA